MIDYVSNIVLFYRYDLVGVTVHTGTADGGHYYSFIKERSNAVGQLKDRWFLFNDAEVKVFEPSQIATECFGGEMVVSLLLKHLFFIVFILNDYHCVYFKLSQSKTYDSVTEKYLDFSFEKTNSAYMLFYERRPPSKTSEKTTQEIASAESASNDEKPSTSCSEFTFGISTNNELNDNNSTSKTSVNDETTTIEKTDPESELLKSNLEIQTKTRHLCDIVVKDTPSLDTIDQPLAEVTSANRQKEAINNTTPTKSSTVFAFNRLNKELEDWIWQDNRHFLQDRNVFEHTYFK